jgi:hypothetical protein
MAASRVRSRAGGLSLGVEVDGLDRTAREFKEVRRRVARELADVEARAAEQDRAARRPSARRTGTRSTASRSAAHLVVRRRARGPELTTNFRGIRARAAGLIEHGGTVKTPILPKKAKALNINGSPRAAVRTARHYRAHRFLQDSVDEQLHMFGEHVRDAIVDFFSEPFEIR